MKDPHVGRWSSGELIDIAGVALDIAHESIRPSVELVFEAANGGMFRARYVFDSRRFNGQNVYMLHRVEEMCPPSPPQLKGYGDNNVRLPMPSMEKEIAQRKREWADCRQVAQ